MNRIKYVTQRMIWAVPVLVLATFLTFSTIYLAPGGPTGVLLGANASPEQVEELKQSIGLDEPIPVQYYNWITQILQGDLGTSIVIQSGQDVSLLISNAFVISFQLAVYALIISLLTALPIGIIAAVHRNKWPDSVSRVAAVIGVSAPSFWLGLILVVFFGLYLEQQWALSGYVPVREGIVANIQSLFLPAIALSTPYAALITRMTRSSMISQINSEYVANGRAMGIGERTLIYRDVFRNAFIPVFTVIGMSFGLLIRGTVLIEIIFGIPGIGKLVTDAAFSRDFPVLQGVMLVIVFVFVVSNLLVDVLYTFIDPRIGELEK